MRPATELTPGAADEEEDVQKSLSSLTPDQQAHNHNRAPKSPLPERSPKVFLDLPDELLGGRPVNIRPVAQGLTGVQGAYIWGPGLYMALYMGVWQGLGQLATGSQQTPRPPDVVSPASGDNQGQHHIWPTPLNCSFRVK